MDPGTGPFEPARSPRLPAAVPIAAVALLLAGAGAVGYFVLRDDGGKLTGPPPVTTLSALQDVPVTPPSTDEGSPPVEDWPPEDVEALVALSRRSPAHRARYTVLSALGEGSVEIARDASRRYFHLRANDSLESWALFRRGAFVWGCSRAGSAPVSCTSDRSQARVYRNYQTFFAGLEPSRLAQGWSTIQTGVEIEANGGQACARWALSEDFARETCVRKDGIVARHLETIGLIRMGVVLRTARLGVSAKDFRKPIPE
jgi:hypothetical protein